MVALSELCNKKYRDRVPSGYLKLSILVFLIVRRGIVSQQGRKVGCLNLAFQ